MVSPPSPSKAKTLTSPAPGALQGHGLARGGRAAVAGGAGVELEEEGLSLHLGVPGEPAVAAEAEQILPVEGAVLGLGDRVARDRRSARA